MSFNSTLYVGIGELSYFYTMRETYAHYVPGPGPYGNAVVNGQYQGSIEVRSRHLFNLSQNADEAIAKATEYAAAVGLPMYSTRDGLVAQLDQIKRATAEQLERRAREAAEQNARWEADRAESDRQDREVIEAGFFAYGRFRGMEFSEADAGYINWMMDKIDQFEAGSINRRIAEILVEYYANLRFPVADLDATAGTIGKRDVFNVTVTRKFEGQGQFGYYCILTMVTDDGKCIVSKGSFCADSGDKLTIKATVKNHDRYNGQMQTVVNRVTVV